MSFHFVPIKFRLAVPLIVLTLLGCSSRNSINAATGAASVFSGGTRTEPIQDVTLNNMTAFEVRIPAKWHFQGTLYQGSQCTPAPNPVFRATSPDGLSYVEMMPALSWRWGTGPAAANMPQLDCLPMRGPMSAQQFLKYLATTMKVHYVSSDPVPDEENAKAQAAIRQNNAAIVARYGRQPGKTTKELARAIVSYKNGTFAMKGRLDLTLTCMESDFAAQKVLGRWGGIGHPPQMVDGQPSTSSKCWTDVTYYTAPENQFDALVRQWAAPGMGAQREDAWVQAWSQRTQQQMNRGINGINRVGAEQRQASAQQFAHDQGVRQQMSDQFISTMQRGTDLSMARTNESMNARTTAASDWVDYSLDQRTVADPNTGQLTKVSNQAATAWANTSGQVYQSRDPNANPNGVLQGNWTQQTIVHGNGNSY